MIGNESSHSMSVEDEGFGFGFRALGWELFAVPEEADAGGIAHTDYELATGVVGRSGGGDKGFLRDQLTIGLDRDPRRFTGADYQGERRFFSGLGDGSGGRADTGVVGFFGRGRSLRSGQCWGRSSALRRFGKELGRWRGRCGPG